MMIAVKGGLRTQNIMAHIANIAHAFLMLGLDFTLTSLPQKAKTASCCQNHNLNWDPLLIARSFPKQMLLFASEHISEKACCPSCSLFSGCRFHASRNKRDHDRQAHDEVSAGGRQRLYFPRGRLYALRRDAAVLPRRSASLSK
jgi:hypothetical protein